MLLVMYSSFKIYLNKDGDMFFKNIFSKFIYREVLISMNLTVHCGQKTHNKMH